MSNIKYYKGTWAIVFLVGLVPLSIGVTLLDPNITEGLAFIPFILLLSIGIFQLVAPHQDKAWIRRLFFLSLLLHFSLSFGVEIFWASLEQRSDGAAYGPHAMAIANAWSEYGLVSYASVVDYPVGAPGYVYFSAAVFWLVNNNTLYIKLINGLLASLSIIYVYKIGNTIFNQSVARFGSTLTGIMPSLLFWTSLNLKDSFVLFLSIYVFWVALEIADRKIYRLPVLLIALFALATIRIETAVGLAIILSITQFFHARGSIFFKLGVSVTAILSIGWLLQQLGYGFLGSTFLENRVSLEAINTKRAVTAYGGSAIDTTAQTTSLADFILYLPTAVSNYLLRPWPWEATGSSLQLATIPESVLIWYPIFVLSAIGLFQAIKNVPARSAPLWMYVIGATVAAAPQYGNLGTAYRHRVQLWPFFFLFAGYAWYQWKQSSSNDSIHVSSSVRIASN